MRRTRTLSLTARQPPPALRRVAVSQPVAGVLAMVLAVLTALPSPAGAPIRTGPTDPPSRSLAGGSLAACQLAVLPLRDRNGGEVIAARPDRGPTAVHGLLLFAVIAGGDRPQRGRPLASRPPWRRSHDTAGAPRAPPVAPLLS